MTITLALGVQTLLALTVGAQPVRFGVPLPAAAVAQGLRLSGPGVLQWRRLPIGAPDADPVWVEIAIAGASGKVRIAAGGVPSADDGRGAAFVREEEERVLPEGREKIIRWRWCDGRTEECRRLLVCNATVIDGETYTPGEARTVWSFDPAERCAAVLQLPRHVWDAAGMLPPPGHLGDEVRKQLALARPQLIELPGTRGAGDFARSDGVVTNLEYDTTLGLLRWAVCGADGAALAQALRCAGHTCDRDFDQRTGLPFPHGPDHRTGVPEVGHAWLQGLLWAGLLAADDAHLEVARAMARGLADHPPGGTGHGELARNFAWPLLELEAMLAQDPDRLLAQAADRLAASIDRRFDGAARTFRFGEGELDGGIYLERGWITGGLVLPALLRHLQRRPDARLEEHVRIVQKALLDQIGSAGGGIATHWRVADGKTFAVHRAEREATGLLMLEGLAAADLRRLARRETFRHATEEVPRLQDPDLPTTFSMVARCTWVWR